MNRILVLFCLLMVTLSCTKSDNFDQYRAANQLDEEDARQFVYSIIRYAGPLAPRSTQESKFEEEFDQPYWEISMRHRLDWYYKNPSDGYTYFGLSRVAPSIHQKRVAIAGRLKLTPIDEFTFEIEEYEEIYRTWRLPIDELDNKSAYLFSKLVNGEDLTPYYPENSGDEEFIEFPDTSTYFDSSTHMWISTLENPAEEMRRQFRTGNTETTSNI